MYSFDNRKDTVGIDEPFYAHYLHKTNKDHPGADDVFDEMPMDIDEVFDGIRESARKSEHLFIKNMAHHMINIPASRFFDFKHVFFIRDPKRVIASISKVLNSVELQDIAIADQWKWYEEFNRLGQDCLIMDSTELLKNPERTLQQLCQKLKLPFVDDMLTWSAGARTIDGSWAKYWYSNTHKSTGFSNYTPQEVVLNDKNNSLYEEALPFYEKLYAHSIHV